MSTRLIAAADILTASGAVYAPAPTGVEATDTAALVAALATGKSVWLGSGSYLVTPGQLALRAGQYIFGQGFGAGGSTLKKASNGILIEISGTAVASHLDIAGLYYLKLDGNDKTGNLVHSVYASHLTFRDVYSYGNPDTGWHIEGYDNLFHGCQWDWCGGNSQPALRVANASDESSNAIWFEQCRWEQFKFGAVDLVGNGFNLHSVYFTDCKMESFVSRGAPFLQMTGDVRNIHVNKMYVALVGYDPGYVAGQGYLIGWTPYSDSSLANVKFYNSQAGLYSPLYTFFGNPAGSHSVQNIGFETSQAYGLGACINHAAAPNFVSFINVRNSVAAVTTPIHGNVTSTQMMGDHVPAFAGAVTDAIWTAAGMPTPAPGQYAIDLTNNRLYVRANATWKFAALT